MTTDAPSDNRVLSEHQSAQFRAPAICFQRSQGFRARSFSGQLVCSRDRATSTWPAHLQSQGAVAQFEYSIFLVGLTAVEDHIGTKAIHRQRTLEAGVEILQ